MITILKKFLNLPNMEKVFCQKQLLEEFSEVYEKASGALQNVAAGGNQDQSAGLLGQSHDNMF
jgi:hypothetical protein